MLVLREFSLKMDLGVCFTYVSCLQGQRHDDSDSEDEWTDEEDDAEALDTADPFLYFADTLRAVQTQYPARFQVCCLLFSICSSACAPVLCRPGAGHIGVSCCLLGAAKGRRAFMCNA